MRIPVNGSDKTIELAIKKCRIRIYDIRRGATPGNIEKELRLLKILETELYEVRPAWKEQGIDNKNNKKRGGD